MQYLLQNDYSIVTRILFNSATMSLLLYMEIDRIINDMMYLQALILMIIFLYYCTSEKPSG